MKIVITESQLNKITGELDEAMGVPEGILEAGEEVYNLIIQELNDFNGGFEELSNDGFEIEHKFKVGNHYFYRIKVVFEIEEHPKAIAADMVGMSSQNEAELDDRFVLQSRRDPDEIIIGFKFYVEPGATIQDIRDYIEGYKNEDIPSLSHEMMHAYRDVVQKGDRPKERANYVANQLVRETFGFIPVINEFFYNSYFIHAIENVVRPTELAAHMRINNVSRKEFLKFFLNAEVILRLKEIQRFSYDALKKRLLDDDINTIKKIFDKIKTDYSGKTDEEIVGMFLRLVLVNLTNSKNEAMNSILTTSVFEKMFGLTGDKEEFFKKYMKYSTKFGYNYDAFFENEEKYFHRVATQMIKKLAKLYDMAKKDSE